MRSGGGLYALPGRLHATVSDGETLHMQAQHGMRGQQPGSAYMDAGAPQYSMAGGDHGVFRPAPRLDTPRDLLAHAHQVGSDAQMDVLIASRRWYTRQIL